MSPSTLFRVLTVLSLLGAALAGQDTSTSPQDRVIALAREIEQDVARLRGLAILHPTPVGLKDKESLKAFLMKEAAEEMPPEKLKAQERALKKIGLLPRDTDLRQLFLELLEEQVAGFYDPAAGELFLIARGGGASEGDEAALDRLVMSHELVHALQDQHFDLDALLEAVEEDDDRAAAVKSLVEGDATLAMMLMESPRAAGIKQALMLLPTTRDGLKAFMKLSGAAGEDLGMPGGGLIMDAPSVIADTMIFEYMGGAKFCASLLTTKTDGGVDFGRIDAVYRKPPLSTEQVMHPRKYHGSSPDLPQRIALEGIAKAFGDSWSIIFENVMGELQIRSWLTDLGLKRALRTKTHKGWDGDRYALFGREGAADALVWISEWDSPEDASEFADAARTAVQKHHRGTGPDEESSGNDDGATRIWRETPHGPVSAVKVSGTRVVIVEDIPSALFSRVLEAACVAEAREITWKDRKLDKESDR